MKRASELEETPRVAPVALSPERYRADLAALQTREFDVVIVGGGIVGAGAALDAATRGLTVALVEAQDFAAGTSSRSSKLIHGGLRYLQMLDFGLVREALHERAVLMGVAPHLVQPLPIIYPLKRRVVERAYVGAGVLLYDAMARLGRRGVSLPVHRQLSRRQTLALAPALDGRRIVGAIRYFDGQVDDARHTFSVVRTAVSHGAVAVSRVRAVGLVRDGERVVGVRAVHVESGEELDVRARTVLSATGVWTEQFEALAGGADALRIQPSKGVHLVVARGCIDSATALILPTEKSVLFVLPWGAHWIIGTTDTPWTHELGRPAASSADVDYLLAAVNSVLARPLRREDVESVYVGLRPLIAGAGEETTKLSREHAVNVALPGLVLVSGGKYTTYRVMARDAVDAAVTTSTLSASRCRTDVVEIAGAHGYARRRADLGSLASRYGVDEAVALRLLGRYGGLVDELLAGASDDPSLLDEVVGTGGYLRAEIVYAVTHEGARHLADVLERRTRAAIETSDRAGAAASETARIMAPLLGWSDDVTTSEVRSFRDDAMAQRAAEGEPDDAAAERRLTGVRPLLPLP